jgi:site-specific DNA-cytosine methylase
VGSVDLVCGGPPCQGVSGHNMAREREHPLRDPKNSQLNVFLDFVSLLRPQLVVLENVSDLLKWLDGFLARWVMARLVALGMQASLQVLLAGSFGLCTSRPRTIMMGAAENAVLPKPPRPTHDPPKKSGRFYLNLPKHTRRLVQRRAERVASLACPVRDASSGKPLLHRALTLGDVIGDRARYPVFAGQVRPNNQSDHPNKVWRDRWLEDWCPEDARGNGGVLNHVAYVLNADDAARVPLVGPRGNWRDIQRAVERAKAEGRDLLAPSGEERALTPPRPAPPRFFG